MTKLHHEIRIAAASDRVWPVLADLEAVQRYNHTVSGARYLSDAREGLGTSRRCELKPKGYVCERVIGWEPGKAITLELYEHQWPIRTMTWRTELIPDGRGTRVAQEMAYEMKFGILGALLDRLAMRRNIDRTVGTIFERLKRYIETGSPEAGNP
jgi:carbon monoxide dehydrogenase subunit G